MRFLAPLLLLLTACGADGPVETEFAGNTMGTQFSVKIITGNGIDDTSKLQSDIETILGDVERMMSTYMPDSEISTFNADPSTDWHRVSAEFCSSVEEALALSDLTGGAFDITVGPLVNLWGFGPDGQVTEVPSEDRISTLLANVGFEHLHTDCDNPAIRKEFAGLVLDMSAFGKGYAADRVGDILDASGYDRYLVEIGGDLRLKGLNVKGEKWAIGIEVPLPDQRKPHAVVRLTDTAVATSGDYRNYFEVDGIRYSHTIDTRTGKPVTHELASATIVDDRGSRADALATAFLVLGPERSMELATNESIAGLFLLRTATGIEELETPAFSRLR